MPVKKKTLKRKTKVTKPLKKKTTVKGKKKKVLKRKCKVGMFSEMDKEFTKTKKREGKQLNQADKDFTATKKAIFGTKKTKKKSR